jgi:hypothetical protein
MAKQKFTSEKEGQITFFQNLKIDAEIDRTDNTDGVYKGTIFEFKLTIPNINIVLFQTIKYLSHLRIKGKNIPKNILLVSLNEEIAYLFDSSDFLTEIEQIYNGAASRNNDKFDTKIKPEKIKYGNLQGLQRITEILNTENFIKINIDVFCVVGWAERFYRETPNATKIQMFNELRNPKHFKDFIYAWEGNEQDFKYIMDCLNDRMNRKELGAFYTPPAYCKKATELVRKAIKQIPKEHDYIILDRCAGTGNLEEFLTDKNVDNITIDELAQYISTDLKTEYLKDKANVIATFYSEKDFNNITMAELEQYKTKINIRDELFDNELSHCIVNTYELKEWVVLNERIGDKVKMIIPPPIEVKNTDSLVNGGDALSENFILGKRSDKLYDMTDEYYDAIDELNGYVNAQNINIIIFENPPYRDTATGTAQTPEKTKAEISFIKKEMEKYSDDYNNDEARNDLSNQFIWSAKQYYLTKPNDAFILFSPVKYFKSLGLDNGLTFMGGYLLNRNYFHASPSAISLIYWLNSHQEQKINLSAFDINEIGQIIFVKDVEIKKVYNSFNSFYGETSLKDGINLEYLCDNLGCITHKGSFPSHYRKDILGYLRVQGFTFGTLTIGLTRLKSYIRHGFYIRSDNYLFKLPLFCAKLYPQKNWYERDIYFTTADGGDRYTKDADFLKQCFIFSCLSQRNHCLSFVSFDGRFYKNELCFDADTVANTKLKEYELTIQEQELLNNFTEILSEAKKTENYNAKFSYGTYQIDKELNTRYKDEETDRIIYNYPELNTKIVALKTKLSKYYEEIIQSKLFEYELLK